MVGPTAVGARTASTVPARGRRDRRGPGARVCIGRVFMGPAYGRAGRERKGLVAGCAGEGAKTAWGGRPGFLLSQE